MWGGLYDDFVRLIGDFLVMCSVAHFTDDVAAGGIIPTEVIVEMEGLLNGCKAANANTNVTMDRIITLNYGCVDTVRNVCNRMRVTELCCVCL